MKKVSEEEFQNIFFKNLFKKIIKSYLFEEKNFTKIFGSLKVLDNKKLAKFDELNEENAEKLAKKFVKEMKVKGKSFETMLKDKDEKKLVKWVFENLYLELKGK